MKILKKILLGFDAGKYLALAKKKLAALERNGAPVLKNVSKADNAVITVSKGIVPGVMDCIKIEVAGGVWVALRQYPFDPHGSTLRIVYKDNYIKVFKNKSQTVQDVVLNVAELTGARGTGAFGGVARVHNIGDGNGVIFLNDVDPDSLHKLQLVRYTPGGGFKRLAGWTDGNFNPPSEAAHTNCMFSILDDENGGHHTIFFGVSSYYDLAAEDGFTMRHYANMIDLRGESSSPTYVISPDYGDDLTKPSGPARLLQLGPRKALVTREELLYGDSLGNMFFSRSHGFGTFSLTTDLGQSWSILPSAWFRDAGLQDMTDAYPGSLLHRYVSWTPLDSKTIVLLALRDGPFLEPGHAFITKPALLRCKLDGSATEAEFLGVFNPYQTDFGDVRLPIVAALGKDALAVVAGNGNVYVSLDRGSTWSTPRPYPSGEFGMPEWQYGLLYPIKPISGSDNGIVLLPVFDGQYSLYRSSDLMVTWERIATLSADIDLYDSYMAASYGAITKLGTRGQPASLNLIFPWVADERVTPPDWW